MSCAIITPSFGVMTLDREEVRAWLRAILVHLGWTGTELARRMGKPPSTINRFLNDPDATHVLSIKTLKGIEEKTGYAPLKYPDAMRPRGFGESDATPFDANATSGDVALDGAVRALCLDKPGVDPWILRSTALDAIGFLPGDVMIVSLNERPRAGDIVCAQVYDWGRARAETVFRVYEPPYLMAATTSKELLRPHVVDDERVVIKGVMLQSLRPRRAASAA